MTVKLVIGPLMETQFRRALEISGGSFAPFFTRPPMLVVLILALAAFLLPLVLKVLRNRRPEIRGG